MRRDVFQAIADPTRRKIIDTLNDKPLHLNAIAENFHISRPAISKHIKILTECGLIIIKQNGRERYCEVNYKSLRKVSDWVDKYRIFWTQKLDALGDFLEKDKRSAKQVKSSSKTKTIKKSKSKK
jgi:DNA-binding transcriptional ArsR family regulator